MARVKLPALSIGIQGNLSRDIYYRKRRSSTVACTLTPPTNPRSEAQQLNRDCFRSIPAHWSDIKAFPSDVASWELIRILAAKGGSAYNEFCRRYKEFWAPDPRLVFLRNFRNWHVYLWMMHVPPGPDVQCLGVEFDYDYLSPRNAAIYFYLSSSYPNATGVEYLATGSSPDWETESFSPMAIHPWPTNHVDVWVRSVDPVQGLCFSGLFRFNGLQVEE